MDETIPVDDCMKVFVGLAKEVGKESASVTPMAVRWGEEIIGITHVSLVKIQGKDCVVFDVDADSFSEAGL